MSRRRHLAPNLKPPGGASCEPAILRGPAGATYSLVCDDMGRIEFVHPSGSLNFGDAVEVMAPHC